MCLICGVALAVLFHDGVGGIRVPLFVGIAVVALVVAGRQMRRQQLIVLGACLLVASVWTLRTSWWVLIPCAVVLVALAPAASLVRSHSLLDLSWSFITRWIGWVIVRILPTTPGWLIIGAGESVPAVDAQRALRLVKSVMVAAPVVAILALLLAAADPLFAATLTPDMSPTSVAMWCLLFAVGALVIGCLLHLDATPPSVAHDPGAAIGRLEALAVLTGVSVVFSGFVIVQVLAAIGLGEETLAARGMTVAEYARSGYFQLLAVVFLTSVVLVGLDYLRGGSRQTHGTERMLSVLIIVLTLVIEVVAIQRLLLYVGAFGFTMLRLACLAGAVWMTLLLLSIGASVLGVQPRRKWLPGAVGVALVVTVLGFGAINPEAFVVRYNVSHNTVSGLDLRYLASLSDDAVPELVDSRDQLTSVQAAELTDLLCDRSATSTGWAGWSLSRSAAADALEQICP
jgi:hypothetical protein